MKKYIYATFISAILLCSSCVSKDKYDTLENDMNKLEKEYDNLVDEYNALVNKYNSLVDDYKTVRSNLSNNLDLIDRAKDDAQKLRRDFNSYRDGWSFYNINDIERDIRTLINTLDGWY